VWRRVPKPSFDHLNGEFGHASRHSEAQRLGGLAHGGGKAGAKQLTPTDALLTVGA
jgi:hypothetical protein